MVNQLTLGGFLEVLAVNPKNSKAGIFVTVIGMRTKNVAETYMCRESAKERIWKSFKPETKIEKIMFLECITPTVQILVDA